MTSGTVQGDTVTGGRTGTGSAPHTRARVRGPLAGVLAAVVAFAAGLAAIAQPPVPIQPIAPAPGSATPGSAPRAETEPPSLPSPAPFSERLRYNSRQRTAEGIRAWEEGRYGDADAALGRALALDPGAGNLDEIDPLGLHNAGTARLGDGDPAEAARLLAAAADRAAAEGAAELEVDSRYNLGAAGYAGGEYAAAADAFRDVLRRRPGHREAKHNLELALRRLAEQQQAGGDGDRPPPEGGRQGEQEQEGGEGEGEGRGGGQPDESEENPPESEPQAGPGERPPQPPPGSGSEERESRLPDFAEQPDMSAEQAAALLDAVESLERQRRRVAAERRARRTARERDW